MSQEKEKLLQATAAASQALERAVWTWTNELEPRGVKGGDADRFATLKESLERAINKARQAITDFEKEGIPIQLETILGDLESGQGALNLFLSEVRSKTNPSTKPE